MESEKLEREGYCKKHSTTRDRCQIICMPLEEIWALVCPFGALRFGAKCTEFDVEYGKKESGDKISTMNYCQQFHGTCLKFLFALGISIVLTALRIINVQRAFPGPHDQKRITVEMLSTLRGVPRQWRVFYCWGI